MNERVSIDQDVILQKLLDVAGQIARHDERLIKQREMADERQKQLALQGLEYLRRLDELNHSHALNETRQATFISREVFENSVRDIALWRERTQTRLDLLGGRSVGLGSAGALFFQILPLIVSAIALAALFLK